jgi:hypothetical protein
MQTELCCAAATAVVAAALMVRYACKAVAVVTAELVTQADFNHHPAAASYLTLLPLVVVRSRSHRATTLTGKEEEEEV